MGWVPDLCQDSGFLFKLLELVLLSCDTYFVTNFHFWLGDRDDSIFEHSSVMLVLHLAMPSYLLIVSVMILNYFFDDSQFLEEFLFISTGACLNFAGAILIMCGNISSRSKNDKAGAVSLAFLTSAVMVVDCVFLIKTSRAPREEKI